METLLFGIFPPDITHVLLPIIIFAIIGSLLCYIHRFLAIIALPAFLAWCIYQIDDLEFFTGLLSNYMLVVYSAMFVGLASMLVATYISWKRHRSSIKLS